MTRTRNLADLLDSSGDVKTAALDNVSETSLGSLGITATAAELNIMDGVTATTAELNYVDGVTSAIQTQIDSISTELVNDTTPQLGGSLDVNGNSIVSVSNGNIAITPNGTGSVVIDGLSHPQSDGSAGQFLKTDGSGNLSFATVDLTAINVSDDTTPQLGGNLDTNGNNIEFADDAKATFGNDADLKIFHSGTASVIQDSGTGPLRLRASETHIQNPAATETIASFIQNGAVELYYDNAKKFETTSTGIDVTGNATFDDNGKAIFGAGNDLQIYHNGSHSRIEDSGTGKLQLGSDTEVEILKSGFAESMAKFIPDGAVELYHNNSKKLETTSTGVDVTGDVLADTVTLDNGSNDWQFSVSGNNLIISIAGTAKAKLDSSGNLTVVGDVTAFGTI